MANMESQPGRGTQKLSRVLGGLEAAQDLFGVAARKGVRFGLRGGVLRNLLFEPTGQRDGGLFDFVDPFSDIDIVVESPDHVAPISQEILSSLPFAGFIHWDFKVLDEVLRRREHYPSMAAERIIAWFDPKSHRPQFTSITERSVEDELNRPLFEVEIPEWNLEHSRGWDAVLAYLRFLRVSLQYERMKEPGTEERLRSRLPRDLPSITPLNLARLNRILANIVATAFDLGEVHRSLHYVDQHTSGSFRMHTAWLTWLLPLAESSEARITILAFRSNANAPSRFSTAIHFGSQVGQGNEAHGWLLPPIQFFSEQEPECCGYRDFAAGPAVAVFRKSTLSPDEVHGASISATIYPVDPYSGEASSEEFPIPGMLNRYRHGSVLRFDPAFAVAYTGRRGAFVAFVSRSFSGEEQ